MNRYQAFKELKGDLGIRAIYHQREDRIEAHIFVAFLAGYALWRPDSHARAALENLAAIQMVDAHLPTTYGRRLVLSRYTQPEPEQKILLDQLRWRCRQNHHRGSSPPPRATAPKFACGADLCRCVYGGSMG